MRIYILSCLVLIGNGFLQSFLNPKLAHKGPTIDRLWSMPRKIDVGEGVGFAKDLVKHQLLSATDEFGLARQYKVSVQINTQRDTMEEELNRIVSDEELSKVFKVSTEELANLEMVGYSAKRKLVQGNMRLVFHIAKYYRYRGVAYPDLVQEGTFGLIKAVDKYDPDRGFRFSTYASWWIKQAVSRAIAEKSRIIRLPVHIHDMMLSITRAEKQFISSHSRKPTPAELAQRLALPVHKVELLLKCARDVSSIDENAYQNKGKMKVSSDLQVKDRLMSEITLPTEINEKKTLRSELRTALNVLSEREAQIVEMRFGLSQQDPMTLEEIGKAFGVTRERIRQIESRALAKLRNPAKGSELQSILQEQTHIVHESMINNSLETIFADVM
mmetsp:Transcript_5541/g.5722  ORF Transcript_5541/g.5722 Transcript_5541/m.5722 type:complete len:386 (+) Transcript_5541:40-1197(+)